MNDRTPRILIYGAYGAVGRAAVRWLDSREPATATRFVLAGRREAPLRALVETYGHDWRAFTLDDRARVEEELRNVDAVVLLAGPFDATAPVVLEACLATGTHYVDISGEKSVARMFFETRRRDLEAAGIVAVPAAGFDTVVFDCLAATLAERLPEPSSLELGFAVTTSAKPSAGTIKTMLNMAEAGEFSTARVGGQLASPPPERRQKTVALPALGPTPMAFSSLTDVYTAYFSTGIENIFTYMPKSEARGTRAMSALTRLPGAKRALQGLAGWLLPDAAKEDDTPMTASIWGRVAHHDDESVAWATVDDAKLYTAVAAIVTGERLASANHGITPGPHTPATAFGPSFAFELPGATLHNALRM